MSGRVRNRRENDPDVLLNLETQRPVPEEPVVEKHKMKPVALEEDTDSVDPELTAILKEAIEKHEQMGKPGAPLEEEWQFELKRDRRISRITLHEEAMAWFKSASKPHKGRQSFILYLQKTYGKEFKPVTDPVEADQIYAVKGDVVDLSFVREDHEGVVEWITKQSKKHKMSRQRFLRQFIDYCYVVAVTGI